MPAAIVKAASGKQYRCTEFGWHLLSYPEGGRQTRLHHVVTPDGKRLVIAPREHATAEVLDFSE